MELKKIKLLTLGWVGFVFFWGSALVWGKTEVDPVFLIRLPQKTIQYTRLELLKNKDTTQIEIASDPAYSGKKKSYRAIPVASLFKNLKLPDDAVLEFHCADGFSAPIDPEKLLNTEKQKAVSYLAIEEKGKEWGLTEEENHAVSPGPFYLVWKNPEASGIKREEWPFQLTGFEVKDQLFVSYPAIFPDRKLLKTSSVSKGFNLFLKTCFSCHTLNLQGSSNLGPDLNVPMSPVEYFKPHALRSLIRNPQSLRHWEKSRMIGFSQKEISDAELDDLLAYLQHMSGRRVSEKVKK